MELVANTDTYKATGDEQVIYSENANEFFILGKINLDTGQGYCDLLPWVASARNTLGFCPFDGHAIYMSIPGVTTDEATAIAWLKEKQPTFYGKAKQPKTYPLEKIEMPKAQDSIVNVWTDAELTPNTGIEYTRDVNIVVGNLESAIASITEG